MKDGTGAYSPPVSRQDLYQDYVAYYAEGSKVKPCGDAALLEKAAQFLLRAPEPTGTFTVFPFYRTLLEAPNTGCRKHLRALSKATEILETFCLNLFLQPWKKEIKTLKTFTGAFIYGILPAFSSSTIQSVLASIGYLPHPHMPQSQYRLSEDVDPHRSMLVGFELMLARVECRHLLELLENTPGPQEWLEILQRRAGPIKMEEPGEKKTAGQKEEKEEEEEKKEKKKEEEEEEGADRNEVPLSLEVKPADKPRPRPRRRPVISEDSSIMEMQRTYPDLAIRGRRLLQDNTGSRSINKAADVSNINNDGDDSKAGELANSDSSKAVTAAVAAKSDHLVNAGEMCGEDGGSSSNSSSRSVGLKESSGDGTSGTSDGGRVIAELSGPQAISLHITLRAGTRSVPPSRPGEAPPTAQPPAWTDRQAAADVRNEAPPPSLNSMEEEKELRELAERMDQLHVYDFRQETKRKTQHTREDDKKNKEKRRKEREASKEEEEDEEAVQNLLKAVEEKKAPRSHVTVNDAASTSKRSFKLDPGVMKEDVTSAADGQGCVGGANGQGCVGGANDTKQEGE